MSTKHYAVFGDPIGHSLSPIIYHFLFKHYGVDADYTRIRLPRGHTQELPALIEQYNLSGCNLTMPHKLAVLPLLDEVEPSARLGGSVNTVCVENGRLTGLSTDAQGFLSALAHSSIPVSQKDVLLLGAGGAARTLAVGIARAGARSVTIAARTCTEAEQLCTLIADSFHIPAAHTGFSAEQLLEACARCGLLVNSTPLGMRGVKADFSDLSFIGALKPGTPVCDLIYEPEITTLLECAQKAGHPTLGGLGMLVFQAFAAFAHFTGIQPDPQLYTAVARALRPESGK